MLPTKLRKRPIELGRSSGRSSRNVPSSWGSTRGVGRYGSSRSPTPTGPAPGPPPPWGVLNVLWTLKCITSKPGLARLEPAQDGVEVGAVHVGQRTRLVDRGQQLADAALEQAEGRGVRDHDRGRARAEGRLELLDVDARRRVPTGS